MQAAKPKPATITISLCKESMHFPILVNLYKYIEDKIFSKGLLIPKTNQTTLTYSTWSLNYQDLRTK